MVLLGRPSMSEMLKWGWVQFACTFWVLHWFMARLEGVMFTYRVLDTRVISDMQSRTQRY
jgi:transmembrane protein 231